MSPGPTSEIQEIQRQNPHHTPSQWLHIREALYYLISFSIYNFFFKRE